VANRSACLAELVCSRIMVLRFTYCENRALVACITLPTIFVLSRTSTFDTLLGLTVCELLVGLLERASGRENTRV
jgi:hypothetical protein